MDPAGACPGVLPAVGNRQVGSLWTPEEDMVLLQHVGRHGTKHWGYLQSSGYLPHRDQKACCNRFILLRRKYFQSRVRQNLLNAKNSAAHGGSITIPMHQYDGLAYASSAPCKDVVKGCQASSVSFESPSQRPCSSDEQSVASGLTPYTSHSLVHALSPFITSDTNEETNTNISEQKAVSVYLSDEELQASSNLKDLPFSLRPASPSARKFTSSETPQSCGTVSNICGSPEFGSSFLLGEQWTRDCRKVPIGAGDRKPDVVEQVVPKSCRSPNVTFDVHELPQSFKSSMAFSCDSPSFSPNSSSKHPYQMGESFTSTTPKFQSPLLPSLPFLEEGEQSTSCQQSLDVLPPLMCVPDSEGGFSSGDEKIATVQISALESVNSCASALMEIVSLMNLIASVDSFGLKMPQLQGLESTEPPNGLAASPLADADDKKAGVYEGNLKRKREVGGEPEQRIVRLAASRPDVLLEKCASEPLTMLFSGTEKDETNLAPFWRPSQSSSEHVSDEDFSNFFYQPMLNLACEGSPSNILESGQMLDNGDIFSLVGLQA